MTGMEITEVLGNLGDFIGAIAVIGTIVYLAIQVRLSREATEANTASLDAQLEMFEQATVRDSVREYSESSARLVDPDTADLWIRGRSSWFKLSEVDRERFAELMGSRVNPWAISIAFTQSDRTLNQEYWDAQRILAALFIGSPGGREWWSTVNRFYPATFRKWVDDALEHRDELLGGATAQASD